VRQLLRGQWSVVRVRWWEIVYAINAFYALYEFYAINAFYAFSEIYAINAVRICPRMLEVE
jgi:hypothetical protein